MLMLNFHGIYLVIVNLCYLLFDLISLFWGFLLGSFFCLLLVVVCFLFIGMLGR